MGTNAAFSGKTRGRQPQAVKNDPMQESPLEEPRLRGKLSTKVAPLKEQKMALTGREWTFVQELCAGDGHVTTKEAALRAGYDVRHAGRIGATLTRPDKNPHVVAAIQQYRKELAEKYGTTYERHMRDLMTIRDKALEAGNYGAAVTAEYRRGQALGSIYIDRKEIRHGTIDSMSKEEVMRKLEEIKNVYGGRIGPAEDIDVRDVDETGSGTIQAIEGQSGDDDAFDSDREQDQSGDAGRLGGFGFEIPDDRVEGGDLGEEDKD